MVDARLKNPDLRRFSGGISYRTSRDSWTKYNLEGADKEIFQRAEQLYHQPQFTKHTTSLNLNMPINDKAGLLFSYNRTQSTIPYHHQYLKQWTNQERLNETYVLKGLYRTDGSDTWSLTGIYSPHESKQFRSNVKNGSFTNHGGGYRVNLEWKHLFENGSVDTYLGVKQTHNKVENEASRRINWTRRANLRNIPSSYVDWCSNAACSNVFEGGYGTSETKNTTWTAKQDYLFPDLKWGNISHTLSFGWQADFAQAQFNRLTPLYHYSTNSNATWIGKETTGSCATNDDACLNYDQYFKRRLTYPARHVKAGNNHYALYFEDKINWGRWEITPGLRIDHDRFLGNTDIAHRFTTSFDVFGNGRTKIFGGVNRYYANSMLAYKLRNGINFQYTEVRTNQTSPWTCLTGTTAASNCQSSQREYLYNQGLKTPHSDELNLGLNHRWGNTEWTLKWVQRRGKNQFASNWETIDGKSYTVMNNNGHSSSNEITLGMNLLRPIPFKYVNLDISGGASWSRNKTNTDYYDDTQDIEDDDKRIIIDGKLQNASNALATDYNNPWRVFANVEMNFHRWNLIWSHRLNYQAGLTSWSSQNTTCSAAIDGCGTYTGPVTLYTKERFGNLFTVDWRFSYKVPTVKNQSLNVTLDVLNVFNKVARSRGSSSNNASTSGNVTYKLGRQFWLGVNYRW